MFLEGSNQLYFCGARLQQKEGFVSVWTDLGYSGFFPACLSALCAGLQCGDLGRGDGL